MDQMSPSIETNSNSKDVSTDKHHASDFIAAGTMRPDGSSSSSIDSAVDSSSPVPSLPERENHLLRLLQDLESLRAQNALLQKEIEMERSQKDELLTAKNALNAEIEDLTKNLFEEANGMVACEAQARWNVEQAQKRLEAELKKTQESLSLECEQSKFLRSLIEEEKQTKRDNDPVMWDIDTFAARLHESYFEDFFPWRTFDLRERRSVTFWDELSSRTAESTAFKAFSGFVDECFRLGSKRSSGGSSAIADDTAIHSLLSHAFMRNCLHSDIEPCLDFPVFEGGKVNGSVGSNSKESMLKKLLPAMLKNTCIIEPIPSSTRLLSSQNQTESARSSPLSIRSFVSVTTPASGGNSPTRKNNNLAISSPLSSSKKHQSSISSPTLPIDIMGISKSSQNHRHITSNSFDLSQLGADLSSSPVTSISSVESCPASPGGALRCSLCVDESSGSVPSFRFRLNRGDDNAATSPKQLPWTPICRCCRDRLVSVASLFTLLRHLLQGLHTHRPKLDIYFDFAQCRRYMFYSRAGVPMSFFALSDFEAFSRKINSSD